MIADIFPVSKSLFLLETTTGLGNYLTWEQYQKKYLLKIFANSIQK